MGLPDGYHLLCTKIGPNHRLNRSSEGKEVRARVLAKYVKCGNDMAKSPGKDRLYFVRADLV